MSIFQAGLISLLTWIISSGEAWLAYPMINQPLVLCPLVGVIMGDPVTGIVAGATLQLVFLGVMGIGGTLPPDSTLGAVIGTAFAISMGQSVEVALGFAVPVAMLGSVFTFLGYLIRGLFNPLVERYCAEGDDKKLEKLHVALTFLPDLPKNIILFVALAFGAGIAEQLVSMVPQTFIDGLDYASNLMPAVGIALLLRMMWSKKMAVYFFVGFLLMAFLKIPLIAIAAMGVAIAVVLYLENWSRTKKSSAAAAGANATAEEELFND
jgi:PTS system mannose-specific IIC component/fructoselysine and glucoselysine-specific PTS system IIC component